MPEGGIQSQRKSNRSCLSGGIGPTSGGIRLNRTEKFQGPPHGAAEPPQWKRTVERGRGRAAFRPSMLTSCPAWSFALRSAVPLAGVGFPLVPDCNLGVNVFPPDPGRTMAAPIRARRGDSCIAIRPFGQPMTLIEDPCCFGFTARSSACRCTAASSPSWPWRPRGRPCLRDRRGC
jgi:hypothetical protein